MAGPAAPAAVREAGDGNVANRPMPAATVAATGTNTGIGARAGIRR